MAFTPVCKPMLPLASKLRPYLERIDTNRYYSNWGPLTREFEEQLANHFGVAANELVTAANGTLALTQTLKAFNVRSGSVCVMPSWTFTATPASAICAGLVPYFIDVDYQSWSISPADVIPLLKTQEVGAVIPVAPFGALLDIRAWEKFHDDTGIPVIIDAAAGFDSFSATNRVSSVAIPFMVSLHATKVFGIGEGAVVVTGNRELTKKIRMGGNFGFHNSRESLIPGTNTKLSEYASAVGLAALDEWPEKRRNWQQLRRDFNNYLKRIPYLSKVSFADQSWISPYGLVQLMPPCSIEVIQRELSKLDIETLAWWGKGCHTQSAYNQCPRGDLQVTEYLGKHVLGLPFWIGLEESQIALIFDKLGAVLSQLVMRNELNYAES